MSVQIWIGRSFAELNTRYFHVCILLNFIIRRNVFSGAQTWIYLVRAACVRMSGRVCCRARDAPQGPAGAPPPLRASLRTLTSAPLPLSYASRRSLARPRPSRGGRRRASLAAPPIARANSPDLWRAWHCPCGSGGAGAERGLRKGPRVDPSPAPPLLRPPSVRPLLRASPTPLLCGIFPLGPPARGTVASRVLVLTAFSAARRAGARPASSPAPSRCPARAPFTPPPPFYSAVSSTQHPTSPPARTLRRAGLLGKYWASCPATAAGVTSEGGCPARRRATTASEQPRRQRPRPWARLRRAALRRWLARASAARARAPPTVRYGPDWPPKWLV